MNKNIIIVVLVAIGIAIAAYFFLQKEKKDACEGAKFPCGPSGVIKDEAAFAGLTATDLQGSPSDYLKDMDKGLDADAVYAAVQSLGSDMSKEEAWRRYNRGRNNWAVWTGGNDRFWDEMANITFGLTDLLKTVSSHPSQTYTADNGQEYLKRDHRWQYYGLISEPCYSRPDGPREDRWGLWLDVRDADCQYGPEDPFADETRHPGVKIGSRGETITVDGKTMTLPVGSYYGEPTGIFGLRLFPNPYFDEEAANNWDPERYYTDPTYYSNKDLVRPYRVGMTCGFCHVGPDPSNPPSNFEAPEFANLNNNPGAQYFWISRILITKQDPTNFAWQLFNTSQPGALDTSFVSTDSINNPRTMNAVYNVPGRLGAAKRWGEETLEPGGSGNNKQFNNYPEYHFLDEYYKSPNTAYVPHVLKDGADSVGILGALNRVYLNIGLFSEDWLTHFRPLVGGKVITPIEISVARKNSAMWNANEEQTQDVALFFAVSAVPDNLADAPGGAAYLTEDEATLTKGKEVFAERCARCHSSKIPEAPSIEIDQQWDKYWEWTKTDQFKSEMKSIVLADDFLEGNYLSTEKRVPVNLLQTNACSPLATNGLRDNIWDNFSSETYKDLPSVDVYNDAYGAFQVQHPITGEWSVMKNNGKEGMPAGGRGYTRPPSLISLWSTAPYSLANAVGEFRWEGTVDARMASFDDSIRKWLWPELRVSDVDKVKEMGLPESIANPNLDGYMYRTTDKSYLKVSTGYLPDILQEHSGLFKDLIVVEDGVEMIEIGPIPAGTPVNLISNLRPLSEDRSPKARAEHGLKLAKFLVKLVKDLKKLDHGASNEEARMVYANLVDDMIELSNCSDYVVNRGHYFGTDKLPASEGEPGLSDEEKEALIAFLKRM